MTHDYKNLKDLPGGQVLFILLDKSFNNITRCVFSPRPYNTDNKLQRTAGVKSLLVEDRTGWSSDRRVDFWHVRLRDRNPYRHDVYFSTRRFHTYDTVSRH